MREFVVPGRRSDYLEQRPGAMGAGVNAGCGFGSDANREQSYPQRREQCIRQQGRRSSALERGASRRRRSCQRMGQSEITKAAVALACWSTDVLPRSNLVIGRVGPSLRACPTRDLQRTTAERDIDELKARFLRLPRNRPCIGAQNHVFWRKNRVYSPKAHRWVYWRGDTSSSAQGWHRTASPPSVPGVTACEVDRPDIVSPAAVAERIHAAQAVRRTRAVIGCFMHAANIGRPLWCALQRHWQHGAGLQAQGCLVTRRALSCLFLRQPRTAGRRALLLLSVQTAHLPAQTGPKRPKQPKHAAIEVPTRLLTHMSPRSNTAAAAPTPPATHHIGRHRCSCVSPAFSRASAQERLGTASC